MRFLPVGGALKGRALLAGTAALVTAVVLQTASLGPAYADPSGPVNPGTVGHARAEATSLQNRADAAAKDAARAAARLDEAKAKAEEEAQKAADAAAKAEESGKVSDKNKAESAAAKAAEASAKAAQAQLEYNEKAAASAAAAAAAAEAANNAEREAASLAGVTDGTRTEGTQTLPDTGVFPDNATHSDNVEVVGHVRGVLSGNSSCPAFKPSKCPAFSSLNFVHYEKLGYDVMVANGTGGLAIWSLKDPEHPTYISEVTVNQLKQPGETMTQFWEGENLTVDSRRKLVFMTRDSGQKGLFVIDIKDPWHPVLLGFHPVPLGHTATCINDCRFIWSVGSGVRGVSSPVYVTDVRDVNHPFTYSQAVVSDVRRTGATSGSTHSVDVDFDGVVWVSGSGGVRGYWTDGKHFDPATQTERYATAYDPIPYAGGSVGGSEGSFLHNAYRFPNTLGDRPKGDVLLITNENNNQNCSKAGVFILASLEGTHDADGITSTPENPVKMTRLATYSPGGKPGHYVDPTGKAGDCSAHWFTVNGNIVVGGYYEQGVRFLDISDPRNPQQVGWFRVPDRAAGPDGPAITGSNASSAYWHNGYVYVPDYGRGVDILKFTGDIPGKQEKKVCWNSCEK
ncbi:LVIVD repeat-containing protein [Microtetraspora fusca]|uniref:LVIVD repeat-containing protein n=1 Tax=Microtetraspora fusca TaxID=1997 RepID=A0ABW6V102_MICFU